MFWCSKVFKKIISRTIRFGPNCPFKDLIEISAKAQVFFGVQTFTKKLQLVLYGLTHIALPKILYKFPLTLYKFPLKANIFLKFKNSFKKLYQGQYSLTHIVFSRILYKCSPNTHISFGVTKLLKNCIRDSMVWLLFSFPRILSSFH